MVPEDEQGGDIIPGTDGITVLANERASAVLEVELEDLREELAAADRKYRRHVIWLLLGVSPAAFVPMILALSEFGASALVSIVLLVLIFESWRAFGAKREVRRLERVEAELLEAAEELEAASEG